MSETGENADTKLPDINNNKGEPNGFVGQTKTGSASTNRQNEARSVRANSMSRHSSRKGVPVKPMGGNRSLKDAKKDRQQVEKDAELLANRIALLKQEEMRTWKKIEETRKRAQEVLDMKKKNEERIKKKMKDMKERNRKIRHSQRRVKKLREQRQAEKGKIKEAILEGIIPNEENAAFELMKVEGEKLGLKLVDK